MRQRCFGPVVVEFVDYLFEYCLHAQNHQKTSDLPHQVDYHFVQLVQNALVKILLLHCYGYSYCQKRVNVQILVTLVEQVGCLQRLVYNLPLNRKKRPQNFA